MDNVSNLISGGVIKMYVGKKIKQPFVELAMDLLDSDKIDPFLDFAKFVEENPLTSCKGGGRYSRLINYKRNTVCILNLNSIKRYTPDGSWSIVPNSLYFYDYDKYVTDENLKEFIINSINFIKCRGCDGAGCHGGRENWGKDNLTIFGKNFKNVCNGFPLMIISPSGKALEHTKELILITKNIINDQLTNGREIS